MIRFALLVFCLTLLQTPSDAGVFDWVGSNSCGDEKTHDYYFGQWQPYLRLLYMDHPKFDSKLMRVRSEELTYPVKGQAQGGIISYIEVTDVRKDGTGGCVYIKNGGVGSRNVTLKLKTQRNHGMEFIIRIFGY
nr:probable salivary secreted peptide [Halyomorpha halys]